jgi:hypothetical protein
MSSLLNAVNFRLCKSTNTLRQRTDLVCVVYRRFVATADWYYIYLHPHLPPP